MVIRVKHIVIALACLTIAALILIRMFPSEEKRIRNQFARVSEAAGKQRGESLLTAAAKAGALAAMASPRCELETDISQLRSAFSEMEPMKTAALIRSYFQSMELDFHDLSIEITEPSIARAKLTARMTGRTTTAERVSEVRELECELAKVDGKWLFTRCRVIEVLR